LKKLTLLSMTILMVATSYSQEILQFTKYTISNSSLLSNNVTSLEVLQNGSVWASHDVGINTFSAGSWGSYNTFNSLIPNDLVNDVDRVTD